MLMNVGIECRKVFKCNIQVWRNRSIEAMAAGKPLIVSNIPGLAELVINEENGLLVNPMDIQGLALAINQILSFPSMTSLEKYNEIFLAKYDWLVVAKNIETLYQEFFYYT